MDCTDLAMQRPALRILEANEDTPLVFAVQHFCLHDGPGTRSIVFFKGCPLRCSWCQNPESWRREAELAHKEHLCASCESCVKACPTGAMTEPGKWDPARCDLCMKCVDACPTTSLVSFGVRHSTEALFAQLRPEYDLYRRSGGGVTFSGGEATLFADYITHLARRLQSDGIHVAIETCGLFKLESVDALLSVTDLLLFDIKLFSDSEHRRFCGAGVTKIKANLKTLVERARRKEGPALWPRLPVIPGVTDTLANLEGWAGFLSELGVNALTLVPYHALGSSKRLWLPRAPAAPALEPLSDRALERCHEVFAARSIRCFAPGDEPFAHIQSASLNNDQSCAST